MGLIKRWWTALDGRREEMFWSVVGGLIGGGIGLLLAIAYVRSRW